MNEYYGVPVEWCATLDWACNDLDISNVVLVFDLDTPEGGCHAELCDYDGSTFHVTIDPTLTSQETAIAIFHELVHVKQVLDKRLTFNHGPLYWEGHKGILEGTYGDLPWEKEAFEQEQEMFARFIIPERVIL
jgi:hypothetical protein